MRNGKLIKLVWLNGGLSKHANTRSLRYKIADITATCVVLTILALFAMLLVLGLTR